MKNYILVCCLISIGLSAESASGIAHIAQETSPTDNSQLWKLCNDSAIEVGTLVANKGAAKNPIFSPDKRYMRECRNRLRKHTFLWLEAGLLESLGDHSSPTQIYTRTTVDDMLNMKRQIVARSPSERRKMKQKKDLILVEIPPRNLRGGAKSVLIVKKDKIKFMARETQKPIADYDDFDISGETIRVVDNVKICYDFGGYSWLKAMSTINHGHINHVNINELKKSLCQIRKREVTIPNNFETTEEYEIMSGKRETLVYEVEVELKLQNSDGRTVQVPLNALRIVDRLAKETLRPKT